MFTPNLDQVLHLVRWLLSVAGGYLVTRGTINAEFWAQISGAVVSAVPFVWGLIIHTDASKIAAVAAMPDIARIVTTPTATGAAAEAARDPSLPKVGRA